VTSRNKRLAVLISGRGSNLLAVLRACAGGALDAKVAVVLCNNRDAPGLAVAANAGIATQIIDHRQYARREDFDAALLAALAAHDPDAVLLAGFMRILTPVFVTPLTGRLLNIHPSLLPKYPGLNTHQRALAAGDREAGVTVHFVTTELDGGPPVLQARVPILAGDTVDTLSARVLAQEHAIYPLATRWLLQGRLRLTAAGAELDGQRLPAAGLPYVAGLE